MIKEACCSFEVAKLLKEKGFDSPCMGRYSVRSKEFHLDCTKICNNGGLFECAAPTHQMAMRWLRQEKDIIINVWYDGGDWNTEYYNNEDENFHLITCLCNSYEEAVEVALKYCLENLI